MAKLSRRLFIVSGIVSLSYFWLARVRVLEFLGVELDAIESKVSSPESLHLFHQTSMFLLGLSQANFDPVLSERIYKELIQLPKVYRALNQLGQEILSRSKTNLQVLEKLTELPEPLRPTAQHVVLAWYTGLVPVAGGTNKRIFYDEAFMHSFYDHLRPAPGNCYGAFGYWSKSPSFTSLNLPKEAPKHV